MAWFWSPKYKRKYEIVGYKKRWGAKDFGEDPKVFFKKYGYTTEVRVYYKDDDGTIAHTQVPNDNNVIYKGLKQYCKENKVDINRTYKHWKGY